MGSILRYIFAGLVGWVAQDYVEDSIRSSAAGSASGGAAMGRPSYWQQIKSKASQWPWWAGIIVGILASLAFGWIIALIFSGRKKKKK